MNCPSAGELGGSVALEVGGNVRVGSPGAPGCTTTGVARSGCCAQTGSENKPGSVVAATMPLRNEALTVPRVRLHSEKEEFIYVEMIQASSG